MPDARSCLWVPDNRIAINKDHKQERKIQTMTLRSIMTSLTILIVATLGVLAIQVQETSALSEDAFVARLKSNGFVVTMGDSVSHQGFAVGGKIIKVDTNGRVATVEILDYGSKAALEKDWIVVNGEAPKPRVNAKDFDGRILYWNNDSVLAVDYRAPNNELAARGAANSYLGLPGTGGQQPSPTPAASPTPAPTGGAGSPTPTPAGFPTTGGPLADGDNGIDVAAIAIAVLATGLIVAGGYQIYSSVRSTRD